MHVESIATFFYSVSTGLIAGGLYGYSFCLQHEQDLKQEQKRSGVYGTLLRFLCNPVARILFLTLCLTPLLRWHKISPILTVVVLMASFWYMVVQQGVIRRGRS